MTQPAAVSILGMIAGVIGVIALVAVNALFLIWMERKVSAHMQLRPGPMEVGWHGSIQTIADALKNVGILLILAFAALSVLAILMAGWASNNKYSVLGAIRSVAQNISYEIPLLITLMSIILMVGSFSLVDIVAAQSKYWFVLTQPIAFILYLTCATAETNRAPFDLPEAESELVAGFHTEYSGMRFALFFLAEYTNMFIVSAIATVFFLGGWHGPFLPGIAWFFIKVYFVIFLIMWFRWTFPRVRFDQLITFAWKILIPLAFANLIITAFIMKLR
jgi:NADH-quinone oxidoreductase subunit H